jgi:hypothetical protein
MEPTADRGTDGLEVHDGDPDVDMIIPDGAAPAVETTDAESKEEAMNLAGEEPRIPLKKDINLREMLSKMDEYAPLVSVF